MRQRCLAGMALLLLFTPQTGGASQVFVKGSGAALYYLKRVPSWLTIGGYSCNGYTLERGVPDWEGRVRIRVAVSADVMQSRAPYEPKMEQIPSYIQRYAIAEPNVPVGSKSFKRLADDLVDGCRYESDAVEAILSWIGENMAYDTASRDEDPAQVLEKRRGQCVGLTNLALTLLRSAEIPARPVQGLLLTPDGAEGTETRMDFQLHRFVEVFYPDIGWVLSDPQKTVNFVSTSYLYWRPAEYAVSAQAGPEIDGLQIYRAKEEGGLMEEDLRSGQSPARVYVRKNLDLRYSAAIEGTVQTPEGKPLGGGQIQLETSTGPQRQQVRADGAFSFIGLKGGEYALQFSDTAYRYLGQKFKMKDREFRQVVITVERVGSGAR